MIVDMIKFEKFVTIFKISAPEYCVSKTLLNIYSVLITEKKLAIIRNFFNKLINFIVIRGNFFTIVMTIIHNLFLKTIKLNFGK